MKSRPKHNPAVIIALTAVLFFPVAAAAIQVYPEYHNVWLYGGGLSEWQVYNKIDTCTGSGVFGIEDAAFIASQERYANGVEGAMFYQVGGGGSNQYMDSDSVVKKVGESVTGGPRTLAGLRVSVNYAALPQKPVLRALLKLVNRSDQARTRQVIYGNNAGGDDPEDLFTTSDGDEDLEPRDRWLVTSDNDAFPIDRPVKTWSLVGPGNVDEPVVNVIQELGSTPCITVEYSVRVPPRSTRYLLMFTRLTQNETAGFSAASDFEQEKAYLFKGLKPKVKERILNWQVS